MSDHINGLIVAPVTAYDSVNKLNLEMVEVQAEYYQRNGVAGAFICGTTGESMLLSMQERMILLKRWTEVAPVDFKVIAQVGHTSLEEAKALAVHACESGAWAVGAMPPFFFKPATVSDLVEYCRELAGAIPGLPFYYYHIPSLTGVDFPMASFLNEASGKIPNLAGIKYTSEDMMDYEMCRMVSGGRFDMLFGRDEELICALVLGTKGAIGSTYNFMAPLYTGLCDAFNSGDLKKARELQRKSILVIKILSNAGCSFLAATKAVMKFIGIDCGGVRAPLKNINSEQSGLLRKELEKIGFFDFCSK